MKIASMLGGVVFLLVSASVLSGQELRYLGRDVQDVKKGWIEMQGQYYEVVAGTAISGWGTVIDVSESYLIMQHTLTETEKDNLRRQGAAVYNVNQIKIPNEGLLQCPSD
jgi:hypothetical protein